jgi:hypothetical protein
MIFKRKKTKVDEAIDIFVKRIDEQQTEFLNYLQNGKSKSKNRA